MFGTEIYIRGEYMYYKFFDTDLSGISEYDIANLEYQSFLSACFQYSTFVTFIARNHKCFPVHLEKFRVSVPESASKIYSHYAMGETLGDIDIAYEVRCYRITPTVERYLRENVSSIFEWIDGWGFSNPEDPAFFRADGSPFFTSIIHEGECLLLPNGDEDISSIISVSGWRKMG